MSTAWSRTGEAVDPHKCFACGHSPADDAPAHDAAEALLRLIQFIAANPARGLAVCLRIGRPELTYTQMGEIIQGIGAADSPNHRQRVYALVRTAIRAMPDLEAVLRSPKGGTVDMRGTPPPRVKHKRTMGLFVDGRRIG